MPRIKMIKAYEILDSRGNPTLETRVTLDDGYTGIAKIPSGASSGSHEALELRDGDLKRFHGKGVLKAIANVEGPLFDAIRDIDPADQVKIDQTMIEADGTPNKSKYGANAILSISMAVASAMAHSKGVHLYEYLHDTFGFEKYNLPVPMMNLVNGGAHADNNLEIQEFMIVPHGLGSTADMVRAGSEIYQTLHTLLKRDKLITGVGDEGGYAPNLKMNEQALEYLIAAISGAGYKPGKQVSLGLDAAASEFYDHTAKRYNIDGQELDTPGMIKLVQQWIDRYPISLFEDPLDEDDWEGWAGLMTKVGKDVTLIGDDLYTTNVGRLQQGIDTKASNAVLIKLNQIGTVSETVNCIKLAQSHGMKVAVSHRSGETDDTFIVDLAVASGSDYLKSGAPARTERTVKYNRLMKIERSLKGEKY